MRVTTGILMIILGIFSPAVVIVAAEDFGTIARFVAQIDFERAGVLELLLVSFLWGLIAGGGMFMILGRVNPEHTISPSMSWKWSLSGAICSMLIGLFVLLVSHLPFTQYVGIVYILVGLLALILLIKGSEVNFKPD